MRYLRLKSAWLRSISTLLKLASSKHKEESDVGRRAVSRENTRLVPSEVGREWSRIGGFF